MNIDLQIKESLQREIPQLCKRPARSVFDRLYHTPLRYPTSRLVMGVTELHYGLSTSIGGQVVGNVKRDIGLSHNIIFDRNIILTMEP